MGGQYLVKTIIIAQSLGSNHIDVDEALRDVRSRCASTRHIVIGIVYNTFPSFLCFVQPGLLQKQDLLGIYK